MLISLIFLGGPFGIIQIYQYIWTEIMARTKQSAARTTGGKAKSELTTTSAKNKTQSLVMKCNRKYRPGTIHVALRDIR